VNINYENLLKINAIKIFLFIILEKLHYKKPFVSKYSAINLINYLESRDCIISGVQFGITVDTTGLVKL